MKSKDVIINVVLSIGTMTEPVTSIFLNYVTIYQRY